MKNLKQLALSLALGATFAVMQEPAMATQLLVGGFASNPSTNSFQGGTLLATNSVSVASATFVGFARSAVYRNVAGTLDFYYQFADTGGLDNIGRLSFSNYDNFTTDVSFITDGALVGGGFLNGLVDPKSVQRGASILFNAVGFNYAPGFVAGSTSFALLIRTNATNFVPGTFSVIDGSTSTTASFAPAAVAAIPEPETYALFLAGLAAVGFMTRRRKS